MNRLKILTLASALALSTALAEDQLTPAEQEWFDRHSPKGVSGGVEEDRSSILYQATHPLDSWRNCKDPAACGVHVLLLQNQSNLRQTMDREVELRILSNADLEVIAEKLDAIKQRINR